MGNQNSLKMNQNIFNNILNNSLKHKDSFQFKSIIVKTNLEVKTSYFKISISNNKIRKNKQFFNINKNH